MSEELTPLPTPKPARRAHPDGPARALPRHAAARYGSQEPASTPEAGSRAEAPPAGSPRRSRIREDSGLVAGRSEAEEPSVMDAITELDAQFAAGQLEQSAYRRKKRFFLRQL